MYYFYKKIPVYHVTEYGGYTRNDYVIYYKSGWQYQGKFEFKDLLKLLKSDSAYCRDYDSDPYFFIDPKDFAQSWNDANKKFLVIDETKGIFIPKTEIRLYKRYNHCGRAGTVYHNRGYHFKQWKILQDKHSGWCRPKRYQMIDAYKERDYCPSKCWKDQSKKRKQWEK